MIDRPCMAAAAPKPACDRSHGSGFGLDRPVRPASGESDWCVWRCMGWEYRRGCHLRSTECCTSGVSRPPSDQLPFSLSLAAGVASLLPPVYPAIDSAAKSAHGGGWGVPGVGNPMIIHRRVSKLLSHLPCRRTAETRTPLWTVSLLPFAARVSASRSAGPHISHG